MKMTGRAKASTLTPVERSFPVASLMPAPDAFLRKAKFSLIGMPGRKALPSMLLGTRRRRLIVAPP